MKKTLLFIFLLFVVGFAAVVQNEELRDIWTVWKTAHARQYTPEEERSRFQIFCDNYRLITQMNEEYPETKMVINEFADLTQKEFSERVKRGGLQPEGQARRDDDDDL